MRLLKSIFVAGFLSVVIFPAHAENEWIDFLDLELTNRASLFGVTFRFDDAA